MGSLYLNVAVALFLHSIFTFFNNKMKEGNALYFPQCNTLWNTWIDRAIAELSIAVITVDCYQGRYHRTDLFLMMLYSITTYSFLSSSCVSISRCIQKEGVGIGKGRGIFPGKSINFSSPANCEKIQ